MIELLIEQYAKTVQMDYSRARLEQFVNHVMNQYLTANIVIFLMVWLFARCARFNIKKIQLEENVLNVMPRNIQLYLMVNLVLSVT